MTLSVLQAPVAAGQTMHSEQQLCLAVQCFASAKGAGLVLATLATSLTVLLSSLCTVHLLVQMLCRARLPSSPALHRLQPAWQPRALRCAAGYALRSQVGLK